MSFSLPHNHGNNQSDASLYETLQQSEKFGAVSNLLKQLSDPTRIRIFWLLSHTEECVINISAMLGITSPAASYHLRALKEYGIIESRRDGKEVYYKIADTKECELLHLITEQIMDAPCPSRQAALHSVKSETVEQIHDFLLQNIDKRITIAELATQFLMNPTTLKHVFKETYGISLAAHINEHRMEKAASLLINTDESIANISKAVGFAGQSRFTVAFKRKFQMPPAEYRKRHR